ncbi:hypothetical protein HPULCUR_007814 [Helicostylum pulchrum]|uniref:Uncharacterized protein n=1 Tax=Helicostylum pulchrum TaxID=562976 RepID=A0ABP9Y5T9_9FUNG
MIKSISKKKEIVEKNVFNQICQFSQRSLMVDIADYTPTCCKKHKAKSLSELLGYLLKYMTDVLQHCKDVDTLMYTVILRLTTYINSANRNTASSAEKLSNSMTVEINTLRTSILQVELRARQISNNAPDFNP